MSLKRRITAVSALAVAAVAVLLGATSYLTTRSQLLSQVRDELAGRARAAIGHRPEPGAPGRGGGFGGQEPGLGPPHALGPGTGMGSFEVPPAPAGGGAAGIFQIVHPDGTIVRPDAASVRLPVTARVRTLAADPRPGVTDYFQADIRGRPYQLLAVSNPQDGNALEVALALTGTDSVLHRLLVRDGLLVGGGILLAGVVSLLIGRSALAPVERFTSETESVTSSLERPRRLAETGPVELRRLAGSFNQTLDALERSLQAQRHLIADASHELRTPMAALRSNIQIFLESDRLPPGEREELQTAVLAELDELTQIVADVVALARGAPPSEATEPVELEAVVADAVARAGRRSPGIRFELALEPVVIVNVAERVMRAVTNVIDNARRWSPPEGTVWVTLRGGVLTVRDEGPGFRGEDLPHVFERFYRADAARRMPGSGLGLAIVKQAAEAYGGSVSADNAPGGGALVTVRFGSASPGVV